MIETPEISAISLNNLDINMNQNKDQEFRDLELGIGSEIIKSKPVSTKHECIICLESVDENKISKIDKKCECMYDVCTLCSLKHIQHEIFSKCFLCKEKINLPETYYNITGEKYQNKSIIENINGKIFLIGDVGENVINILAEYTDLQAGISYDDEDNNPPASIIETEQIHPRGREYNRQSHLDLESMLRQQSGNFDFELEDFCSYLHSIGCNLDNYLPEHFIEFNQQNIVLQESIQQIEQQVVRQEVVRQEVVKQEHIDVTLIEEITQPPRSTNIFTRFFGSLFK
jgi:hypothetical protein